MMKSRADRFWAKVEKTPECWLWNAASTPLGYGLFWDGERLVYAHRWAYEDDFGPIPDGLEIDHLCRVSSCVNPKHLEAVTHQENMQRSPVMGRGQSAKTHCKRGHEYTEENTYYTPREGWRQCRECKKIVGRVSRMRARAAAK